MVDGAREAARESGDERRAPPQRLTDCRAAIVEAALARPATSFAGAELYTDLATKAAVLAYSIAKGHACADGNKRLAVILSSAFLELNGHQINAEDAELEHIFRHVAESQAAEYASVEDDLRHWFSQCVGPLGED